MPKIGLAFDKNCILLSSNTIVQQRESSPMKLCHTVSAHVDVPVGFAFGRCCDPAALGMWTLGSMDFAETSVKGVFRGKSLFDNSESYMEMDIHPDLWLVDFAVGTQEQREPRVSIRLTPGQLWGFDSASCLFAMSTWRAAWMDEDRWQRTCRTHETEAELFKAQTETAWAEGGT